MANKSLKDDLLALKTRLETIEDQLTSQSKDIEVREAKWDRMEPNLSSIVDSQGERIVLNVGGKSYTTTKATLLSVDNTLFTALINSGRVDLKEEIFFDRSNRIFEHLLEFLRTKKINYKKLKKDDLSLLKDEAEYFCIMPIYNVLEERLKEITFRLISISGAYTYQNKVAGTGKAEDLLDDSGKKGLCAKSPGSIVLQLSCEFDVEEITIGGFRGDSSLWYSENGSGASIETSLDNKSWKKVGTIPSGYGSKNTNVKLTSTTAKFMRFTHNSYLGIGHLRIIKKD